MFVCVLVFVCLRVYTPHSIHLGKTGNQVKRACSEASEERLAKTDREDTRTREDKREREKDRGGEGEG